MKTEALSNAESAYYYAREVLKARFPDGEAAIAKDAYYAYLYALNVLKGRFPKGEAAIATDAQWSCRYARVLKGRFPAGEAAIAKDACWAYYYAKGVLNGRFPDGEAAIATDVCWACCYARDVLKGRFPEGEAAIAQDATLQNGYSAFLDSMALLGSLLSEEEREELGKTSAVTIPTPKGDFLVRYGGLVKGPESEFCVAFEEWGLPEGDLMLAKILLLKADYKNFEKIAYSVLRKDV